MSNHHIYTHDEVKLKLLVRRQLEDNAIWTRSYMVSLLADLSDIDNIKDRLLKNQDTFGNCIKEFYGDLLISNFINLRKENINLLIDLLQTIKDGNTSDATTIENNLVINIENVSELLSIANPSYSKEDLIEMFNTHLILTKYEFIARMSGDYVADIVYFDMNMHHADMLADYISRGIIEAFFEIQTIQYENVQTEIQPTFNTLNQEYQEFIYDEKS